MQKFWVAINCLYVKISPADLAICLVVGVVVRTPSSLPCSSDGGASIQGSLPMDFYKDFLVGMWETYTNISIYKGLKFRPLTMASIWAVFKCSCFRQECALRCRSGLGVRWPQSCDGKAQQTFVFFTKRFSTLIHPYPDLSILILIHPHLFILILIDPCFRIVDGVPGCRT